MSPARSSVAGNVRWIDVDVTRQILTAYEGQTPVRTTPVSTGLPRTPTPVGKYHIYVKLLRDDMRGPDYYLRDVPYTMYFYKGYGLHGTYWHSNFGHPMSHGCINLPTEEAKWLFNWASVGTLVNIHR
jgi:lipoprotein-anchoring transpeptidase ErfK/SrfK